MTMRLIATLILACGLTCLSVLALVPVARRIGLVDRPGGRKNHDGEVPTIGGLAIVAALVATALVMGFSEEVHPAFWAGLLVIALIGTLDDLRDLGHQSKLLAQVTAAALMVFWGGWHLQSLGHLLGDWPLSLGSFATPLSIFAVIGVVNAVNFTDGADGLAGGLVLNALLWVAVIATFGGNASALQIQTVFALLGAVAGFLVFNLRHPRRRHAFIFLGDAGSLTLGFILAWYMIWGAERPEPLFAPVTAVWLLAVPLMDTLTCSGRRLLNGQSPFKADRKHLHHLLVDLGLPIEYAVATIHGLAFVLAAIGVAGWHYHVPEYVMFYVAMGIFSGYVLFSIEAIRFIESRREGAAGISAYRGVGEKTLRGHDIAGAVVSKARARPADTGDVPRIVTVNGQPAFADRRKASGLGLATVRGSSASGRGSRAPALTTPWLPTTEFNRRKTDRQRSGRA